MQQELDTRGSSGHFLGLLLTPNGRPSHLCPGSCSDPHRGAHPSLQLAFSFLYSATDSPFRTSLGPPPLMLLWMALDACWPQMPLDTVGGGGRTRQKQLRPPWSQGHTNAALDALVSATPIPCIVGQQQPGSDTEAEEFPLSWNLGMGWPLPVSDILLLKGLPPCPTTPGPATT